MPPLSKNKAREHKLLVRDLNVAPANAGSLYYVGAYVCREAATGVVIPGADVAGLVPLGVVVEHTFPDDPDASRNVHLDNTSGADGIVQGNPERYERVVRYAQAGEWAYAVAGAAVPKVGDPAYLVDDDTVSAENGVGLAAENGVIAGHFTRPAPHGGWFIDISRRGIAP